VLTREASGTAHLLVWDEPLNFIDVISRMQIEDLLLESRPTILFAEHDRAFCDRIAMNTVYL
jgi:lincosamide and streptogramin A transport system ATP-binding/permease protein